MQDLVGSVDTVFDFNVFSDSLWSTECRSRTKGSAEVDVEGISRVTYIPMGFEDSARGFLR